MVDIALETREQAAILAVLDHFGKDFDRARRRRCRSDSEKEHTYLAAKVAYEAGDIAARRGAVLQHRPAIPLLRGGAVLPRPHPARARGTYASARRIAVRDRRAGRSGPLHLLHRRPLLRHQGPRLPRARAHLARAGEVRRRVLLLLPRPRGLRAAARRAVRGVLVDVPGGRVRGSERVPRGVRPLVRQDAARARRAAAARDDRPQVVPRSTTCARRWTSWSRPTARCRRRSRRCSRIRRSGSRSTAACSASGRSATPRDPIIELLKIDPRFFKFYDDIVALDREAGLIPDEVAVWDELTAHETGMHGGLERDRGGAAGQRRRGAAPARGRRSGDGEPRRRPRRPGPARGAPGQRRRAAAFAKEAESTLALAAEARKLRAQLVVATSTIANQALVDLDKRLRELLRRARLTHIDAVIGKKKKLEIEIANLRQGRFPADLFATLAARGVDGRRRGILAVRR